MRLTPNLITATLVFSLSACGAGETSDFVDACLASSNMQRPMCECLADKASRELSPTGVELLIAGMQSDDEKAEKLRSQLEMPELMKTGMFMVNAPSECSAQ
ncbi:MAG TPA: hypothetical protein ENK16_00750 [Chromatiales bacterium]|nr:hypothetical protein [Chromatiales bacterium]